MLGFYNRDEKWLQRGSDRAFKWSSLLSVLKFNIKSYLWYLVIELCFRSERLMRNQSHRESIAEKMALCYWLRTRAGKCPWLHRFINSRPRICAEMPMTQVDYSMHVLWFHYRWSDSQLHFVTHPTNKSVVTGAYLNLSKHNKMAYCYSGCCHTLWLYERLTYESIRKLLFV
jgi:hypothetical protein